MSSINGFIPSSFLSMISLLSLPVEGPDPGLLSPSADVILLVSDKSKLLSPP